MNAEEDALTTMIRKHKAALTRARNGGSLTRIIDVCDAAMADFDRDGGRWPDDWVRWRNARDDAVAALVRETW